MLYTLVGANFSSHLCNFTSRGSLLAVPESVRADQRKRAAELEDDAYFNEDDDDEILESKP
jgi:hypothetical protein